MQNKKQICGVEYSDEESKYIISDSIFSRVIGAWRTNTGELVQTVEFIGGRQANVYPPDKFTGEAEVEFLDGDIGIIFPPRITPELDEEKGEEKC